MGELKYVCRYDQRGGSGYGGCNWQRDDFGIAEQRERDGDAYAYGGEDSEVDRSDSGDGER
jgi:hypothetical protein